MNIRLDYITLNGVMEFEILNDERVVGELYIVENPDCYVVQIETYTDFFLIKRNIDRKIDELFNNLFEFLDTYPMIDSELPVLLLEDESIGNRYAINNDLKRVPRYNGFYLYE